MRGCPTAASRSTQRFAAFAEGALSVTLPAAPGWYAAAARFVNAATGQEASLLALGAVLVEG